MYIKINIIYVYIYIYRIHKKYICNGSQGTVIKELYFRQDKANVLTLFSTYSTAWIKFMRPNGSHANSILFSSRDLQNNRYSNQALILS